MFTFFNYRSNDKKILFLIAVLCWLVYVPATLAQTNNPIHRDSIGDLNSESIKRGEFDGSISLPGTHNVSLAIGGTLKTVAIWDNHAEDLGSNFVPVLLGSQNEDTGGGFAIDSTLTRFHLEGRAPVERGSIRGYFEYDLNQNNNGSNSIKIRHAYGSWTVEQGVLTAGQTWSTMMDLQGLPEGLTEPTVSGVIFQRQPLIRWSQPVHENWKYHLAMEDTSNNDISFPTPDYTSINSVPDIVAAVEYSRQSSLHVRLNMLTRKLEVRDPSGDSISEQGWGAALTAQYRFSNKNKLGVSVVEGEGLGRYLLGIRGLDGSAIVPPTNELELRDNHGMMASFLHHWSSEFRSTLMYGKAKSDALDWQPGSTTEGSTYSSANLMWQASPYIVIGVEIAYGEMEYVNGDTRDNTRLALGIQLF